MNRQNGLPSYSKSSHHLGMYRSGPRQTIEGQIPIQSTNKSTVRIVGTNGLTKKTGYTTCVCD